MNLVRLISRSLFPVLTHHSRAQMGRPSRHKIALRQCAANARVSSVGTSGPKAPFSYDTDRRDGITASLKRSPRCPRPQGVVSPEVTALAPAPTPTPVRVPSRRSLLDVTKGTAANRFADVRAVLHRIGESFDDLRTYAMQFAFQFGFMFQQAGSPHGLLGTASGQ